MGWATTSKKKTDLEKMINPIRYKSCNVLIGG
jgi:hypothetical protein